MPRRRPGPGEPFSKLLDRLVREALRGGGPVRLDAPRLALLAGAALLILLAAWLSRPRDIRPPVTRPNPGPSASSPASSAGFLVCSWNVENFFDDVDDPKNHDEDEDWFGRDPSAFRQKVAVLADSLLLQNDGLGPDVLAMVEVESLRCVEALRDALNARLPAEARYGGIVQRDDRTGRRFAPAVLTRLGVRDDLTQGPRDFGNRRILEAHLEARGAL